MENKKIAMGKKTRAQGKAFELKVRADLEKQGWIVSKWSNNVDMCFIMGDNGMSEKLHGKLIPAKSQYNPFFKRIVGEGSGFPDFIVYQYHEIYESHLATYQIIGVESKMTGILDKIEKEKCKWLIENNIFSKILIASKGTKRGQIVYEEFVSA
jgi:hypothetical protein